MKFLKRKMLRMFLPNINNFWIILLSSIVCLMSVPSFRYICVLCVIATVLSELSSHQLLLQNAFAIRLQCRHQLRWIVLDFKRSHFQGILSKLKTITKYFTLKVISRTLCQWWRSLDDPIIYSWKPKIKWFTKSITCQSHCHYCGLDLLQTSQVKW